MNSTVLFLALMLAGTFLGGYNDIQKKKYLTRGIDDQVLLSISLLLGAFLLLPVLLIVGVPEIKEGFWPAIIGGAALGLFSSNLFIRAFKISDASIIASLPLLTPPLVVITGYLYLGEEPSVAGAAGIIITMAGLWFLLFADNPFSLAGVKTMKEQRGVLYGVLGAVLYAIAFPLDKQAVVTSSGFFTTIIFFAAGGLGTLLFNLASTRSFWKTVKTTLQKDGKAFFLYAVVLDASGVLMREALNYSLAAYASSAKRMQALWTVLLSGKLLGEKHTNRRFAATLLMFAGVLITVLWN